MKKAFIKYLLIQWWTPLTLFALAASSFYFLFTTSGVLHLIAYYLLLVSTLILMLAAIAQLIKGKWYLGLLQIGAIIFGGFLLINLTIITSMFGPDTDTFADNLELPDHVKLEYPKSLSARETLEILSNVGMSVKDDNFKFQLYNSFQPGLYEYDFWINSEKSGTLFLKAFEITQEIELFRSQLKENSAIRINSTNGKLIKFGTVDHFTIQEGVWGKPYATKFEVWFQPDNETVEIKLLEKNYVIEGWMR